MSDDFYLANELKVYLENNNGHIWQIPVNTAPTFSQGSESITLTASNIPAIGGILNRFTKQKKTSLAPAEWSFTTHVRPYTLDGVEHAVEDVLWELLSEGTATSYADYAQKIENSTERLKTGKNIVFSNKEFTETFTLYFVFKNNTGFKVAGCRMNAASVSNELGSLSRVSWQGFGTELSSFNPMEARFIVKPEQFIGALGTDRGGCAMYKNVAAMGWKWFNDAPTEPAPGNASPNQGYDGKVYIYSTTDQGESWSLEKVFSSETPGSTYEYFGTSIDLAEDSEGNITIMIGAEGNLERVYYSIRNSAGVWGTLKNITSPNKLSTADPNESNFGHVVRLSGDYALIGANYSYSDRNYKGGPDLGEGTSHMGAAYRYSEAATNLVVDSDIEIQGNTIKGAGSGSWVWGKMFYTTTALSNDILLNFTVSSVGHKFMLGLIESIDPAPTSYLDIDYAWYPLHQTANDNGYPRARIYESSDQITDTNNIAITGSEYDYAKYEAGDTFQISYHYDTIRYYHNGNLRRKTYVGVGKTFYLAGDLHSHSNHNVAIEDIRLSQNSVGSLELWKKDSYSDTFKYLSKIDPIPEAQANVSFGTFADIDNLNIVSLLASYDSFPSIATGAFGQNKLHWYKIGKGAKNYIHPTYATMEVGALFGSNPDKGTVEISSDRALMGTTSLKMVTQDFDHWANFYSGYAQPGEVGHPENLAIVPPGRKWVISAYVYFENHGQANTTKTVEFFADTEVTALTTLGTRTCNVGEWTRVSATYDLTGVDNNTIWIRIDNEGVSGTGQNLVTGATTMFVDCVKIELDDGTGLPTPFDGLPVLQGTVDVAGPESTSTQISNTAMPSVWQNQNTLAITGNSAILGIPYENSGYGILPPYERGRVFIYNLEEGNFTVSQVLDPGYSGEEGPAAYAYRNFGSSVAAFNNTLYVSAGSTATPFPTNMQELTINESVSQYVYNGTAWKYTTTIDSSSVKITNSSESNFGTTSLSAYNSNVIVSIAEDAQATPLDNNKYTRTVTAIDEASGQITLDALYPPRTTDTTVIAGQKYIVSSGYSNKIYLQKENTIDYTSQRANLKEHVSVGTELVFTMNLPGSYAILKFPPAPEMTENKEGLTLTDNYIINNLSTLSFDWEREDTPYFKNSRTTSGGAHFANELGMKYPWAAVGEYSRGQINHENSLAGYSGGIDMYKYDENLSTWNLEQEALLPDTEVYWNSRLTGPTGGPLKTIDFSDDARYMLASSSNCPWNIGEFWRADERINYAGPISTLEEDLVTVWGKPGASKVYDRSGPVPVIKITANQGDSHLYFGTSSADYNIKIPARKKWVVSMEVYANFNVTSESKVQMYLRTHSGAFYFAKTESLSSQHVIPFSNTWVTISGLIDLTGDNSRACILRIDNDCYEGTNRTVHYRNIQIEQKDELPGNPWVDGTIGRLPTSPIGLYDFNKDSVYLQATNLLTSSGSGTAANGTYTVSPTNYTSQNAGTGTGLQLQYVVSGGNITSITVLNGGKGYRHGDKVTWTESTAANRIRYLRLAARTGMAYIWERIGNDWQYTTRIAPPTPFIQQSVSGPGTSQRYPEFGKAVSISKTGNTLAVASPFDAVNYNALQNGSVYIYKRKGSYNWEHTDTVFPGPISSTTTAWDHDSLTTTYNAGDYVYSNMQTCATNSYATDSGTPVPAYDPVEDALILRKQPTTDGSSADIDTGVSFDAFDIGQASTFSISLDVRGNVATQGPTNGGLFIRVYTAPRTAVESNTAMYITGGSVALTWFDLVLNAVTNGSGNDGDYRGTSSFVSYNHGVTLENVPISETWKRASFTWTPEAAGDSDWMASLNVLNWGSNGTNNVYVKNVKIQENLANGSVGRVWDYSHRVRRCKANNTTGKSLGDSDYWDYPVAKAQHCSRGSLVCTDTHVIAGSDRIDSVTLFTLDAEGKGTFSQELLGTDLNSAATPVADIPGSPLWWIDGFGAAVESPNEELLFIGAYAAEGDVGDRVYWNLNAGGILVLKKDAQGLYSYISKISPVNADPGQILYFGLNTIKTDISEDGNIITLVASASNLNVLPSYFGMTFVNSVGGITNTTLLENTLQDSTSPLGSINDGTYRVSHYNEAELGFTANELFDGTNGSGATFDITFTGNNISDVVIVNAGEGYKDGDSFRMWFHLGPTSARLPEVRVPANTGISSNNDLSLTFILGIQSAGGAFTTKSTDGGRSWIEPSIILPPKEVVLSQFYTTDPSTFTYILPRYRTYFGHSVALSNSHLLLGASYSDLGNDEDSGVFYAYKSLPDFPITNLSINISNGASPISYPLLGEIDKPLGFTNSTLSITGEASGYLIGKDSELSSKEMVRKLLSSEVLGTSVRISIGGTKAYSNRLEFNMPKTTISNPDVQVSDITSFSISFSGESTSSEDSEISDVLKVGYKSSSIV